MRAGSLRETAVGLHLHGVNQIGKLDCILDKEDRNVVTHQIPVALLRVQLDGETAHVARRVYRA